MQHITSQNFPLNPSTITGSGGSPHQDGSEIHMAPSNMAVTTVHPRLKFISKVSNFLGGLRFGGRSRQLFSRESLQTKSNEELTAHMDRLNAKLKRYVEGKGQGAYSPAKLIARLYEATA